jgi:hypothetical protein
MRFLPDQNDDLAGPGNLHSEQALNHFRSHQALIQPLPIGGLCANRAIAYIVTLARQQIRQFVNCRIILVVVTYEDVASLAVVCRVAHIETRYYGTAGGSLNWVDRQTISAVQTN